MKSKFFEHYQYTDDEKKDVFSNGIFIFDTNVLLNLYRYTVNSRDEVFHIMEVHNDRIWIPYQVGWEFLNNRRNVIDEVKKRPDELAAFLNDARNKFLNTFVENRHPLLPVEEIKQVYNDCHASLMEKVNAASKDSSIYDVKDDVVWNKLSRLFDAKVGDDCDAGMLKQIYTEGKERYENKIPPGYSDSKNKKEENKRQLYGDLILWKQVMIMAKELKKDVVFVTSDVKEDWFQKTLRGEAKHPRVELIKEFSEHTGGKRILIYNQNAFLYNIEKYLGTTVNSNAHKEIKEVSANETKKEERQYYDIPITRSYPVWLNTINTDYNPLSLLPTVNSFGVSDDIYKYMISGSNHNSADSNEYKLFAPKPLVTSFGAQVGDYDYSPILGHHGVYETDPNHMVKIAKDELDRYNKLSERKDV